MLDFKHSKLNTSSKDPTAVIAALVGYSKAFNRMDHSILVTLLSNLNIPTCALRLITSYLSGRSMCVRYKNEVSEVQRVPGGGPQGGLITIILFNLQVNKAGSPCPVPRTLDVGVSGPEPNPLNQTNCPPCHTADMIAKKKFVDDLTMLEAVRLNVSLTPKPPFIGPRNSDDIGDFFLLGESSILQHQLFDLQDYTRQHKMMINQKKTKLMVFNMSQKNKFSPLLTISEDGDPIDVIDSTRLLGATVSSCLKWNNHVEDITNRATKKLWILIRFKSIGANRQQLLKVYCSRVRMTLQTASPVFHTSLTLVQKKCN